MKTPYDVIIKPVISERSMEDAQNKKYTFKVAVDANKTEVKQAVEEIFDVEVKKVNIMNVVGKQKRILKRVRKSNSSRVCNTGGKTKWESKNTIRQLLV